MIKAEETDEYKVLSDMIDKGEVPMLNVMPLGNGDVIFKISNKSKNTAIFWRVTRDGSYLQGTSWFDDSIPYCGFIDIRIPNIDTYMYQKEDNKHIIFDDILEELKR